MPAAPISLYLAITLAGQPEMLQVRHSTEAALA